MINLSKKIILKLSLKVLHKCTLSWAVRNFVEFEIYIITKKFIYLFDFFHHLVAKGFQNSYFKLKY